MFLRLLYVAILSLLFSTVHASDLIEGYKLDTAPKLVIKAPINEKLNATIAAVDLPESSIADIKRILEAKEALESDVIVSTDNENVIKTVNEITSKKGDRRQTRFLPIGKLAHVSQKIASGFKEYYENAKNTLKHDRIGLTVLTITIGYDSLIWIHSASFDIQQKTSMILMNLVLGATFGLDRDLWSRMVAPTKNRLIKIFDKFLISNRLEYMKTLSSQFMANMLFSLAIQTTRTGLLSLDHLSQAVTGTEFWTTAVKISGLVTLTTFAWSELFGYTDSSRFPVAKLMLKRLGEMRGIILSQLASISMVLQPHIYGSVPALTFVIHGTMGLIFLYKADSIIEWLENNKTIQKFYKKVQTFENFINNEIINSNNRSVVRSCRSLFAQ